MKKQIIDLAQQLIEIESTEHNKDARSQVLDIAISQLDQYTVEKFEKNGFESALVYASKSRPDKFKLILNCHLDVVPGKKANYQAKIKSNRLIGVGALDMKANAAVAILVFNKLASKLEVPIGLQLTTDEEVGGFNGTLHQVESGVKADFVITTEPTNFDIVNQAKGVLHLDLTAQGKTAHGAYPWRGTNAIEQMCQFLNSLKKLIPQPTETNWATSLNISWIETENRSYNKIPDLCRAGLDIRFVPGDDTKLLNKIRDILPDNILMDVLVHEPAMKTSPDHPDIKKLLTITESKTKQAVKLYSANGTSDARHFARIGVPGIEFGAIGGDIGSDDEWVDINSLITFAQILEEYLLEVGSES